MIMRTKLKALFMAFVVAAVMACVPLYAMADDSSEYKYVYAGLTWGEYWASEGVYGAGDTSSSDVLDSKKESDKGGYDAVTRATTNHGLHRGSFQSMATIYAEDGSSYEVSHWSKDGKTIYLTDGTTIGWARGTITKEDGSTTKMTTYDVTGIKYVPVAVKASDYEAFAKQYRVVADGETLYGGYSEMNLQSYEKAAKVTADTNGLKTATKNADGSFSFSARKTGADSGLSEEKLNTVSNVNVEVLEANGSYGEFLRVDFNGDGYGALGSAMYAVRWDYYGNASDDVKDRTPLASYGTKFAADNWMHKAMGIQLGLTDSARCQLPKNTDGTGYWSLTVYAMGYEDYTVNFQVTDANLVKPAKEEVDTGALSEAISMAESLVASQYTKESWDAMQLELEEAKEALNADSQAVVDEALAHLKSAMDALVLVEEPIAVTLKDKTVTYNGKAQTIGAATVTGSTAKASYAYYSDANCTKEVAAANVKNAGVYYVKATVQEDGNDAVSSEVAKLTIKRAKTTISTKATSKNYKVSKLKKKAQTFKIGATANSKAAVKYTVTKKNAKVSVSKAGVVTVKKGTKKGTYKTTVKITSAKNTNYEAGSKTVTVKVVVK